MLLPHVAELLTILSTQKMMTRNEIFDAAITNVDTTLRSSDHISQILTTLKDNELVVRHADRRAFAITAKGKQALLEHSQNQPTINEPAPQAEPQKPEEEEKTIITANEPSDAKLKSENANNHRNPALAEMINDVFSKIRNPPQPESGIAEIVQLQLAVIDKLQQFNNQNTLPEKQAKIDLLHAIAQARFVDIQTIEHLLEIADYLQKAA